MMMTTASISTMIIITKVVVTNGLSILICNHYPSVEIIIIIYIVFTTKPHLALSGKQVFSTNEPAVYFNCYS